MEPNTEQITERQGQGRNRANEAIQEALLNALPSDQVEAVRAKLTALLPQIKTTYLSHEVGPATQTLTGFLEKLPQQEAAPEPVATITPETAPQEATRE